MDRHSMNTQEVSMGLDLTGNSYIVEMSNYSFQQHQIGVPMGLGHEVYQRSAPNFSTNFEVSESPRIQKRSRGQRSGTSAMMDAEIININPTGVITYMSVEEARAQGLIEETMNVDTEYCFTEDGQNASLSNGGVQGHMEAMETQDDDSLIEFNPEEFTNTMHANTLATQITTKPMIAAAPRLRTVIPIRRSSVGGTGKATPGAGTDNDMAHPFVCDLCSDKFKKKLFLNNHMESRHGIKFVFTEKGKKVKLVRMPTEVKEGEKLDPCVRLLMDSNGNNSGNVIGVQPVETLGEMRNNSQNQNRNPTAHEVDPNDILQGKVAMVNRDFSSALRINTIRTWAMKKVRERGETPFVAYRPFRSQKLYLLTVTNFSKDDQLLMNATEDDLENSEGTTKLVDHDEGSETTAPDSIEIEPGLTVTKVIRSGTKFSHVAIVVLVEQVRVGPRELVYNHVAVPITEPILLMHPDYFARSVLQGKPKRLRCLSMPQQSPAAAATKDSMAAPKRKYTRRSYGRRSSAFDVQSQKDLTPAKRPEAETPAPADPEAEAKATPAKKKKKNAEEDMKMSDDDETDATYSPYRSGGGQGSGKRGRGRPRRACDL